MTLKLNEFNIDGSLQVSNFAKPALRFDLESKLLDVDALLGTPPPDKKKRAKKKKAGDGKQKTAEADEDVEIALPMQTLRDLDIDGDLRIAKMKMQNLKLRDFEMHLSAQDGLLSLKPVNVKAYDGEVQANVAIDVKGEVPKYGVDKSFKGVQVGDLLEDYLGESPISGRLNGEVNLTTRGEWLSKLKKNSNGSMSLKFLDGALNGFNLRQSIEAAKTKLTGGGPPAEKTLKTDFTSLTLSGVIRKGVFSSDDLDLQAPLLRVSGKGEADLNSDEVDYLVYAKLVGSVEGQKGDAAKDLAGLTIPVRIKGPFTEPEIAVQMDELLKANVDMEKEKLKKEIEAQKEGLEKLLKKEQKALEKSRQRELEKQLEVDKARAEKKLKEELQKLLE
jgi:AsmA protein